jgi:hypothetical protein
MCISAARLAFLDAKSAAISKAGSMTVEHRRG